MSDQILVVWSTLLTSNRDIHSLCDFSLSIVNYLRTKRGCEGDLPKDLVESRWEEVGRRAIKHASDTYLKEVIYYEP